MPEFATRGHRHHLQAPVVPPSPTSAAAQSRTSTSSTAPNSHVPSGNWRRRPSPPNLHLCAAARDVRRATHLSSPHADRPRAPNSVLRLRTTSSSPPSPSTLLEDGNTTSPSPFSLASHHAAVIHVAGGLLPPTHLSTPRRRHGQSSCSTPQPHAHFRAPPSIVPSARVGNFTPPVQHHCTDEPSSFPRRRNPNSATNRAPIGSHPDTTPRSFVLAETPLTRSSDPRNHPFPTVSLLPTAENHLPRQSPHHTACRPCPSPPCPRRHRPRAAPSSPSPYFDLPPWPPPHAFILVSWTHPTSHCLATSGEPVPGLPPVPDGMPVPLSTGSAATSPRICHANQCLPHCRPSILPLMESRHTSISTNTPSTQSMLRYFVVGVCWRYYAWVLCWW